MSDDSQQNGTTMTDQPFDEYKAEYLAWRETHDWDTTVIAQDLLPLDATLTDLPQRLERRCCYGKSCGNTEVQLVVDGQDRDGHPLGKYAYTRVSNDDVYFSDESVAGLVDSLNCRKLWPVDEDAYDELMSEHRRRGDAFYAREQVERERLGLDKPAPGQGMSKGARRRRRARLRAEVGAAAAADGGDRG